MGRTIVVGVDGPSDLLSAEFDVLERGRIYESVAAAAAELAPLAV
jgi:hypothetical protein